MYFAIFKISKHRYNRKDDTSHKICELMIKKQIQKIMEPGFIANHVMQIVCTKKGFRFLTFLKPCYCCLHARIWSWDPLIKRKGVKKDQKMFWVLFGVL